MILTETVVVQRHSSLIKKMSLLNILCVNGYYTVPTSLFLLHFPKSNTIKIKYLCSECNLVNSLCVASFNRKKYKDVCGICLKSKVLVGSRSNAYGKKYCKGVKKTDEHKEKLRGPRPCISGPLNPNWKHDTPEYKRYKGKVHQLSNKVYKKYKHIINPNNYSRTICGVEGGWQLDHIISIKECYKKGYNVYQAADISNLQMLPWKDNLTKSVTSKSNS